MVDGTRSKGNSHLGLPEFDADYEATNLHAMAEKLLHTHPFLLPDALNLSEEQKLIARRLVTDITLGAVEKDAARYAKKTPEEQTKAIVWLIEDSQSRAEKILMQLQSANKLKASSVIKPSALTEEEQHLAAKAAVSAATVISGTSSVAKIFEVIGRAPKAARATGFISIAATVTEFLVTGGLYLAALVQRKTPPKVSNKQKLAYLGVSTGLIVAGFVFPPAAAAIGAAMAGLGFIYTAYAVFNVFREKNKTEKSIKSLKVAYDHLAGEVTHSKDHLHVLEHTLALKVGEEAPPLDEIESITNEIEKAAGQHDEKIHALRDVKRDLFAAEKKYAENYSDTGRLAIQGLEVGLAALTVVGAAFMFVAPPIGLTILGATAAAGLFSITAYFVHAGVNKLLNWRAKKAETEKNSEKEDLIEMQEFGSEDENALHLQSTSQLMQDLYGDKAGATLQQLVQEEEILRRLDLRFSRLLSTHNLHGALSLFSKLAEVAEKAYQEEKAKNPDSQLTMEDFCQKLENFKPAVELFGEAIAQVNQGLLSISVQDKATLTSHPEFAAMLQESHGVDVFSLKKPLSSSGRAFSEDSAPEP